MNTKLKYIVGMFLGALFTIPLASSALSVFTVPQGGTASSSLTGILKGNGKNAVQTATPGTDYVLPSALSSYLSLSSWYATTTDGLDEGLTNLYFTNPRVLTYLDTISKGYFFSTTSADYWKTQQTDVAFSTTSANYWVSLFDKGYFWSTTSADSWESTKTRWGTTSADYWIGTKNTDALAQGSTNKYFADSLVDTWLGTKSLGIFFSTTSADYWHTTKSQASSTLLSDTNTWSGTNVFPTLATNSTTGTSTFAGDVTIGQVSILNGNGGANASLLKIVPTKTYGSGSQNQGDGALLVSCNANNGLCAQVTRNNASAVAPLALDYITSASDPYTVRSIITAGTGAALTLSQTNSSASQASQTITNAGSGAGLVINMTKTTATSPGLRITATSTNASASTLILEQPFYVTMVLTDLSKNNAKGEGKFQLTNRNDNFRFEGRDNSNLQYSVSGLYNRPNSGGNFVWGGVGDIFSIPTGMATFNVVQSSGTPSYVNVTSTTTSASKYGDIFTILNSGNVGIGTTSPYAKLSVVGETVASFFTATTTSNNTFPNLTFTNATGTNATTSSFAVSNLAAGLVKALTGGSLVSATLGTDYVNGSGTNGNCVAWGASNALTDAGAPCGSGSGGGASQWATSTLFANMIHTAGANGIGIGTTTPFGALTLASSSPVSTWMNYTSGSANNRLAYMTWNGSGFVIGTSTDLLSQKALLTVTNGTSTFDGNALTVGTGSYPSSLVQGVGTSTMWGGINLSNGGCFAVSGVCMGTMALSGSVGQVEYFSGVNTAVGTSSLYIATSQNVGIGTTSPYAKLSVQGTEGLTDAFAVASSTLATMFNVTANGRVGIGSSTPWGTLSIIDSISGSFFPGVITATSTTDLPYFGWTASTSEYAGSAVRILAGNPSAYMSSADSLDQLLLNGRVNTGDWKQLECASDFNSKTAQITGDITGSVMSTTLGKPCGDFSYIEDANGVADQVVTTGSGYIRLRPGATGATVVAGDGFGLAGTTAFLRHATNTPVYLATVRPGAVQNASTSIYMLGFSAATGVSANYATDAQDGCFFVASSTKANWQAVCRSTTATIVDTGVASSTVTTGDSAWRQFRIDMIGGPTPYAVFRIKQSASASWGPPVATIATTMPTAVSLNPITSVGKVSAGLSPELHINRIRVWYNDPLWY